MEAKVPYITKTDRLDIKLAQKAYRRCTDQLERAWKLRDAAIEAHDWPLVTEWNKVTDLMTTRRNDAYDRLQVLYGLNDEACTCTPVSDACPMCRLLADVIYEGAIPCP